MTTIKDVAKEAGVSIATVSNVINNKGNISDAKYDCVMRIVKKMNYRPSIIAKNLKKKKTKFIAVIMPSFENRHATIFKGIQSVLDDAGYFIIPKVTEDNAMMEKQIIQETIALGVSGYLIVPAMQNCETYAELVKSEMPVIFMERKIEGFQFSSVIFDNKEMTKNIAKQCLEQYGREEVS
ncbi:MAG: LacI family DNA-binding transcriptional regulator, partial [Christensenella sp.]